MAERLLLRADVAADWTRHAEAVGGRLFSELRRAGFHEACGYDSLSDLGGLDLLDEFETLVNRSAVAGEMRIFKQLVDDSHRFAGFKRRLLMQAFVNPSLRGTVSSHTAVFSQRELLRADKIHLAASSYPSASNRKLESKEEKRKSIVARIGRILVTCNFPSAAIISSSSDPDRMIGKFGAGKRLTTLCSKVSAFGRLHSWMVVTFQKPFPTQAVELMDFLLDLSEHPCGPSVPASTVSMVSFFEDLGNVQISDKVGRLAAVHSLVDELRLCLSAETPKLKRKANQYFISLVTSCLLYTSDAADE